MVNTFKRIFDISLIALVVLGLTWLAVNTVSGTVNAAAQIETPVQFASN